MKKTFRWLFVALCIVASVCACSEDGDETRSLTQMETSTVMFSFFDVSVSGMGPLVSRADTDGKTLKDVFSRIDVAIFPLDSEGNVLEDKVVKREQTSSTSENFGDMTVKLPVGKYTVVAVASKARGAVVITSPTLASFSENSVTDMACVCQDITVKGESTTANISLKRAVTKFTLVSTDLPSSEIVEVDAVYTGLCDKSFNPQTGYAVNDKEQKTLECKWKFAGKTVTRFSASLYTLIPVDKVLVNMNVSVKNANGDIFKTINFADVVLQQNHETTYTGPVFSLSGGLNFSFDFTDFLKSDGDKTFEE